MALICSQVNKQNLYVCPLNNSLPYYNEYLVFRNEHYLFLGNGINLSHKQYNVMLKSHKYAIFYILTLADATFFLVINKNFTELCFSKNKERHEIVSHK